MANFYYDVMKFKMKGGIHIKEYAIDFWALKKASKFQKKNRYWLAESVITMVENQIGLGK